MVSSIAIHGIRYWFAFDNKFLKYILLQISCFALEWKSLFFNESFISGKDVLCADYREEAISRPLLSDPWIRIRTKHQIAS